jgi:nucleotide-binding universal stress UspA family protein
MDGSEADPDALEEAFEEAGARRARLEVVHAWRPVSPYDAAIVGRGVRGEWERTTRKTLTVSIEAVAIRHPRTTWGLRLEYARVTVALHEAAVDADLMILGRHGRNAPMGRLLGSNTRTLLHSATCPIVVVPVSSH